MLNLSLKEKPGKTNCDCFKDQKDRKNIKLFVITPNQFQHSYLFRLCVKLHLEVFHMMTSRNLMKACTKETLRLKWRQKIKRKSSKMDINMWILEMPDAFGTNIIDAPQLDLLVFQLDVMFVLKQRIEELYEIYSVTVTSIIN